MGKSNEESSDDIDESGDMDDVESSLDDACEAGDMDDVDDVDGVDEAYLCCSYSLKM
jgi:hypothetical protein